MSGQNGKVLCTDGVRLNWCALGSTSVNVNGANISTPNFNDASPVAQANYLNVKFQVTASDISAEVPMTSINTVNVATPNFNNTTPAAETGYRNVKFQQTGNDISAEITNGPSIVASVSALTNAGNIISTPLYTTSAQAMYRFSCYESVTASATVSSTLPQCQVGWVDGNTGVTINPVAVTAPGLTGNNLTTNTVTATGGGTAVFYAAAGTIIRYQTTGYASNGATAMNYDVRMTLEYLGP